MKMTKETKEKEKEKEKEKVRTKRIFKFPTEIPQRQLLNVLEVNGFFPNSPRHEGKVAVYMGKYRNDRVEEEHEFSSDASYAFT